MKKILLLLTLIGSSFSSFSVELQVRIEDYYNDLAGMYGQHVYITSMEERVTINNVLINRGNCRIGTAAQNYQKTLSFGQKVRVTPLVTCSVIEITINTDKGTETYSRK